MAVEPSRGTGLTKIEMLVCFGAVYGRRPGSGAAGGSQHGGAELGVFRMGLIAVHQGSPSAGWTRSLHKTKKPPADRRTQVATVERTRGILQRDGIGSPGRSPAEPGPSDPRSEPYTIGPSNVISTPFGTGFGHSRAGISSCTAGVFGNPPICEAENKALVDIADARLACVWAVRSNERFGNLNPTQGSS